MGFSIKGSLTGSGLGLMTGECCKPLGSICGTVVKDIDCDGNINFMTDPGANGVIVQAIDNVTGLVVATQTTDQNGNYCISNLPAGTYIVSLTNNGSTTYPLTPFTYTVPLVAGGTGTANFGICSTEICGKKFNDANCNGIQDPGEPAMSGWTIILKNNLGVTIATQVTNGTGKYCFANLTSGINNYIVSEVNQTNWSPSYPTSPAHTLNLPSPGIYTANFLNCLNPCSVEPKFTYDVERCKVKFTTIIPSYVAPSQIVATEWTFGDGTFSNDYNPVHYYSAIGTYNVCLRMTIFNGLECCVKTYCTKVQVRDECSGECEFAVQMNQTHIGCFYNFTSQILYAGLPVSLVHWNFGDGTTAVGNNVTHNYMTNGTYTVTLTIFGSQNGKECCSKSFTTTIIADCCVDKEHGNRLINFNSKKSKSANDIVNALVLKDEVIVLEQNKPNPFTEGASINYNIPTSFSKASIEFKNIEGRIIKTFIIKEKGEGTLNIMTDELNSGFYIYTLIVDGRIVDSKKMIKN